MPGHLKVIDLFAGAGLFGGAFRSEGFDVVQAVERDLVAVRTHRANALETELIASDITKVTPARSCDVLIAGPPCQGFSTLNRARCDDPRNRLGLEVVKWAKATRPSVVLIENVAPFLQSQVWEEIAYRLTRLGYVVEAKVLDAVDFGVAQYRRRSFTIASMVGIPKWPERTGRRQTVRQVWRDLAAKPNGVNHHVARTPSTLASSRMKLIPSGGDKRDVLRVAPELAPPSWHRTKCEVTDVWGRLEWDAPANTLRTCLLNASKGRYIHPEEDRVISIREAARLHSISDSYKLMGTPYQIARQIGNSVPPKLGRTIARVVRGCFTA
jgi:DNA (cytosine-5)-methyltransferase 1